MRVAQLAAIEAGKWRFWYFAIKHTVTSPHDWKHEHAGMGATLQELPWLALTDRPSIESC